MKKLLFFAILLPGFAQEPITRIACGSCYKPERDNRIFRAIAADKPQTFLFMGDNIYADTDDPNIMKEKYHNLNIQPDYAALAKTIPIIPIWDDHDYGLNDAGREYKMKEASAQLFFEAFKFPKHHEAQKTPGVYHSRIMGPQGKRVQFIMLDTRYFRSPLKKIKEGKRKVYQIEKGPDATILGKAQWQWLKAQLKKAAELRIIVSSIQVINTEHRFEKWSNIPNERKKLLKLLGDSNPGPTILLSGDRHLAEVCRIRANGKEKLPFDLYEMTCSGMTHAGAPNDPSHLRVPGTYSREPNYGLIDINWGKKKPEVTLSVKTPKQDITTRSVTILDFNDYPTIK